MEYLAIIAFNAYGNKADWKTWDGKPMPKWEDVGTEVQSRWLAAAKAINDELAHQYNTINEVG